MPEGFATALQIPSQLVAERVGLPYWLGFLMVGWGITATLMAGLTSSPVHLYLLRFFLGRPWDSCGYFLEHSDHACVGLLLCTTLYIRSRPWLCMETSLTASR